MIVLGIETSCDETSAAVVRDGVILSNEVSSQVELHEEYGGVVPELAARAHLENLLPVCRAALKNARVQPEELDLLAATLGPGLPTALLVGANAAQGLAFVLRRPFIGVHHHEAHLYSPWIRGDPPRADWESFQPNVSLIVSGGHTLLIHVQNDFNHQVLGGTIDDAAGECFDKAAKLIGAPYPGGPAIDQLSRKGDPSAHSFPRPLIHEPNFNFSFSGLKTAIRYFIRDHPQILESRQGVADLCASVQWAIVETLVKKTIRAAERTKARCVTASGGVACNSLLRQKLAEACAVHRLELRLAAREYSTDNAAMIATLAERKHRVGAPNELGAEIKPGWAFSNS